MQMFKLEKIDYRGVLKEFGILLTSFLIFTYFATKSYNFISESDEQTKIKIEKTLEKNLNDKESRLYQEIEKLKVDNEENQIKMIIEQEKRDIKAIGEIKAFLSIISSLFFGFVTYNIALAFYETILYFIGDIKKLKKETSDYILYDFGKYKDIQFKSSNNKRLLMDLVDIDKSIIKDTIQLINSKENVNFIKQQLTKLYNDSVDLLVDYDKLYYVSEKYKNTFSKIKDFDKSEQFKLYEENQVNLKKLMNKFEKNLETYSYILIHLPKLNEKTNINSDGMNASDNIKELISNIVYLKNPNVQTNDMMKKYNQN